MHSHFPGPRGDGSVPGCGAEPREHRQVPGQPQDHGPDQQTQLQVWWPAALKRAQRVCVQFQYSAVAFSHWVSCHKLPTVLNLGAVELELLVLDESGLC